MKARWTIHKLAELAELALRRLGCDHPVSGRVRAVPDERTIRYYTTLGLIDRPAEMRGRVAYYGPRHLLQLIAIKKLQAEGWPLVAIQERLAGISDTELEQLAGVSADFWNWLAAVAPEPETTHAGTGPSAKRGGRQPKVRRSFWKHPALVATEGPPRQKYGESAVKSGGAVTRAVHLELAPGVRLVIEGADCDRLVTPEVARQLQAAAEPVVELVRRLEAEDGGGRR